MCAQGLRPLGSQDTWVQRAAQPLPGGMTLNTLLQWVLAFFYKSEVSSVPIS